MIEYLIIGSTILLAISLFAVLIVMYRWNKENDQPSYLQSMQENYRLFCEMTGIKHGLMSRINLQNNVGYVCTLIVPFAFFKLHNDDRDPCKIDYIKVDEKLECTFVETNFSRR